jgi:hypothetical protein
MLIFKVRGVLGFWEQYVTERRTPAQKTITIAPVPDNARTFGPFINRTHACTYFYFNAALALALTFWHYRRKKDSDRLGGPHLISLFIAFLLFFGVFLTFSVGGILISLTLVLFVSPITYFLGLPTKDEKSLGHQFCKYYQSL